MGCTASRPEVQGIPSSQIQSRTTNTETWDDDFKLPSKSLDGGPKISSYPENAAPPYSRPAPAKNITGEESIKMRATATPIPHGTDIRLNNPIASQIITRKLPNTPNITNSFNPHLTFLDKKLPSASPLESVHEHVAERARTALPVPGNNLAGKNSGRIYPAAAGNNQERSTPPPPVPSQKPQQHQQRTRVVEHSGIYVSPVSSDNTPGQSGRPGDKSRLPHSHLTTNSSIPNTKPPMMPMPMPNHRGAPGDDREGTTLPSSYGGVKPHPRPMTSSHRGPPPPNPNGFAHPRPDQDAPVQQRRRRFVECYDKGSDLGKGAFAKVFIGIEHSNGQKYAVKQIVDRNKMRWNGRDALMDEIGNLQKLRQAPNIVYLHEYFMEENQCYLVMELLPGKELFERIIQKSTFTEEEARNSCRCVLSALAYMHDRRMAHRDLKPENLLLVDELDIDKVKLTDFGFSKSLEKRNECRTLCGTPGYLAPEILERWPAYDVKCDTWSFGVILFLLLGGYLPFDSHGSNDTKQVFERTRNGQYYFYPQRWGGISQAAKDLIAKCLTVGPINRISAQMALAHEWMGEGLALPRTMISAQSLASTYFEKKKQRKDHDKAAFLKELNDDFTVYMGEREGDSIVSAMTGHGAGRGVGGRTVPPMHSNIQEDSTSGRPFSHFYTKEAMLGEGGFAQVFRCRHKDRPGITYAVKEVNVSNTSKAEAATLRDEITVLKYLRGAPFIIRLYDVFEEDQVTYLVLEEMKGGDLLHRIVEKEVYTEREARDLCKILFTAVNFCHKKQIAHRDIKLENLLLQEENNDASIKLADFGFAKKVKRKNGLKTMLGTPTFMAPEIFDLRQNGYDHRCDLWSIGVVVYCLLGGYLPFEGEVKEISVLVMRGDYSFHDEYWRDISPSAKKLISALLQVDPSHRLSAQQALSSRWMTMDDAELSVKDLSLTKSRMERMVTGKEKFKNAVRAIIGVNKLQAAAGLRTSIRDSEQGLPLTGRERAYLLENMEESESELDIEVCFDDVYEIGQPIGVGSLAKIHSAKNLLSNKVYSVKKVIRRQLHPGDFSALSDEIAVLQEVAQGGKTHVVCLYEVYEDPDATYLVMDRIHGDILIDRLIQKKKYTEFDAKELVRNLLQGVHHCHQKSIAIRNLTLDNLLLPKGSESDIMITDFEIAKKVLYRNSLKTQCGTQEFVAPEVLENRPQYDVSCDIWTVGVIVFILLGGYYPFRGKNDAEILKNVRYGNFEFRVKLWKGVSEDAKALLRSMMTVNPDDRVTAGTALTHSWIKADNSVLSADLSENVAEMKREVGQKFKAAVKTVLATQRLQHHTV